MDGGGKFVCQWQTCESFDEDQRMTATQVSQDQKN